MSRFQLLAGQPFWGGNARTRIAVAKEAGRILAGIAAMYGLAYSGLYAFLGPPDRRKKNWAVNFPWSTDPRSPDWGTIQIGTHRIDPTAGMKSIVAFVSRTGAGVIDRKKLAEGDPLYQFWNFVRSKTAPWPKALIDRLAGETMGNEEATPYIIVRDLAVPLSAKEIIREMLDNGVLEAAVYGMLQVLGFNVRDLENMKRGGYKRAG